MMTRRRESATTRNKAHDKYNACFSLLRTAAAGRLTADAAAAAAVRTMEQCR